MAYSTPLLIEVEGQPQVVSTGGEWAMDPLPENQLDRFMLCIEIGYPTRDVEKNVLTNHRDGEPVDKLGAVLNVEQLERLQRAARTVRVDDSINDYMLDLVHATRAHEQLQLGVSTRGAITLYRAAQSLALVEGRNYVIPDDVKRLVIPALAHRIVVKGVLHEGRRERAKSVLKQILAKTPVPS